MLPTRQHIPGEPKSTDIPQELEALADSLVHPLVVQTGITCDSDGNWALFVTVPKTTSIPIPDLEAMCAGFPIVYEAESDEPRIPY